MTSVASDNETKPRTCLLKTHYIIYSGRVPVQQQDSITLVVIGGTVVVVGCPFMSRRLTVFRISGYIPLVISDLGERIFKQCDAMTITDADSYILWY